MATRKNKPLSGVKLPFRELSIPQIPDNRTIRVVHRSFVLEIPETMSPEQLTAIFRGLV